MDKPNKKVIAVTGGGTGGHIFPNVAVIEELRERNTANVLWIGEKNGKEQEWARNSGVPYYGIQSGKLRRYFSVKNLFDLFRVFIGVCQSFFILKKTGPAVVFSKGGFVSVPPVIAARLRGIPVITHESDVIPGLATRIISRFASIVCVSFEKSDARTKRGRIVHTGNPVRRTVKQGKTEAGKKFLRFVNDGGIVTVLGGSLGASSINSAVWDMVERFSLPFNLVHQCGQGNAREGYENNIRYRQFEFIGAEMGAVLAASDVVVSRAGAGALYEIGFMKKPSLLVPLPRSKSRGEQIANARFFQEHGASDVLLDEELNGRRLFDRIEVLLADENRLKSMGEKAHALCSDDAEKKIAALIEELLS